MADPSRDIPDWLAEPQDYRPGSDRDGFIAKSLLAVSSVLARLRLDDGRSTPLSPSAQAKLVLGFEVILLTSLARNYLFVLIVLAGLLVRVALLPRQTLSRVVGGSLGAAGLTMLVMTPAALLGQSHAALLLGTKALVSVGTTLTVALTTPAWELTHALRFLHVPDIVILTIDLALRSIVSLGQTAAEVLTALRLRSVGRNRRKGDAMGGVGGIVLLKASRTAQDTHDAMRCRGFDGTYHAGSRSPWRRSDVLALVLGAAICLLFLYLQEMG